MSMKKIIPGGMLIPTALLGKRISICEFHVSTKINH